MKGIEESSNSSSSTWIKVGGALLREQHGHVPVDVGYRRAVYKHTQTRLAECSHGIAAGFANIFVQQASKEFGSESRT